jgi:hypothetical protein
MVNGDTGNKTEEGLFLCLSSLSRLLFTRSF